MSDLKLRPRFKIDTNLSTDEAEARINALIKTPHNYEIQKVKGHFILRIPEQMRHYWSPQMDISIYNDDYHETTQVRCLLAPAPAVWTMFVFFYSFFGFGILFGLIIGSSQYTLNKHPWGFWMALGSLIIVIGLFLIAQFGKRISKEEMREMKKFVHRVEW